VGRRRRVDRTRVVARKRRFQRPGDVALPRPLPALAPSRPRDCRPPRAARRDPQARAPDRLRSPRRAGVRRVPGLTHRPPVACGSARVLPGARARLARRGAPVAGRVAHGGHRRRRPRCRGRRRDPRRRSPRHSAASVPPPRRS
jgi:hypothetical protein